MSEENGNGRAGAITKLGGKLITSLPAQFLALVLMTGVFNIGMIWFFVRQGESRERVLTPLIEACSHSVPLEIFKVMVVRGKGDND